MNQIWKRIKSFLSIPSEPLIGFVFATTAILSAIIILSWFAIPDTFLTFSKTSLLGYSIIQIIRVFIGLLFPMVFIISRYHLPDRIIYGLNPGMGAFILSFLCGFPSMLIYVSIHNIFTYTLLSNDIMLPLPAIYNSGLPFSSESILLVIIVSAALPILVQELFFRGLLYALLPSHHRGFTGIVLIALLFAIHMLNPVDFIPLFLLGLLLGYIRHATDNILCPMLTQTAMVICFFIFKNLLPYLEISTIRSHIDIDITVIYISAVVLTLCMFTLFPLLSNLYKTSVYLRQERADYTDSEPSFIRPHLLSHAMLMAIILYSGIWALILSIY